jgi:WD40 repeat protein
LRAPFLLLALLAALTPTAVQPAQKPRILSGHTDNVYAVAFSPDGKVIVSASGDNTAILWDLPGGRPRATLEHDAPVYEAVFSPDGKTVATCGGD